MDGALLAPNHHPTIYADEVSPVTLRIHALDDPVIRVSGLTASQSARSAGTPQALWASGRGG